MIALINTFHRHPDTIGSIESLHRSREAAERANVRLQRAIKRSNGRDCYMPTTIRRLIPARWKAGEHVRSSEILDDTI
jgi:hypothetical protein